MTVSSLGWWYKSRLCASVVFDLVYALLSFPWLLISFYILPAVPTLGSRHEKHVVCKSAYVHDQEVKRISESVRTAHQRKQLVVLHRRPGHGHSARSAHYKAGHHAVDVASLTAILSLDVAKQQVTVQAGISFESLCRETLKYNLLPLVVPEFKSITVGGAIQGIGIESSSWHNGAVDETVITATMILGNGDIVQSTDVPELWNHVPGSNGSLALVVAATIRLRPAGQVVKIRYQLLPDFREFRKVISDKMVKQVNVEWSWQTADALVDAVLIRDVGIMVMFAECPVSGSEHDAVTYQENPFSPFFFQHVEQLATQIRSAEPDKLLHQHVECMPTMQYLFRYDRGGFWGIMALGKMFSPLKFVLERPTLTGCMNHFLKTSTLYKLAMLLPDFERETIAMLQDVDMPETQAEPVIAWAVAHGIEYLWLCPVRNQSLSMFAVSGGQEWVLNVGVYGSISGLPRSNRELQRLVATLRGKIALYAHVYVNEKEFWSWYEHGKYMQIRQAYHGSAFLDLYRKVGGISQNLA